jgi:hypothetical protein
LFSISCLCGSEAPKFHHPQYGFTLALSIPLDKCENNADIAELDQGKRDFSQQLHGEVTQKGLEAGG